MRTSLAIFQTFNANSSAGGKFCNLKFESRNFVPVYNNLYRLFKATICMMFSTSHWARRKKIWHLWPWSSRPVIFFLIVLKIVHFWLVILTKNKQKFNYVFSEITSSRWLEIFCLLFSKYLVDSRQSVVLLVKSKLVSKQTYQIIPT